VQLTLLGVRGSTPAPGAGFVRYGGHTSAVAVTPDGAERPTLLLDAGTGLRNLPALLGGEPFRGSIFLSHLHWDHVTGLPFCPSVDRDDARVRLCCPAQDGRSGRDLLAQLMSPPGFPIPPEGLRGAWEFHALAPGRCQVDGFDVVAVEVAHKGGRTFGYRVQDDSSALVYLPDHAPAGGVSAGLRAALQGVDLLIHDAQFVERERVVADAYGHATIDDAVRLATDAGVPVLMLFHHAPGRSDDEIDSELAGCTWPPGLRVLAAREGDVIVLPW